MDTSLQAKVIQTGDAGDSTAVRIRPVARSQDLFGVYKLTHDFHVAKGSLTSHPDGIWSVRPEFDHISQTTILLALVDNEPVGSITFTRDGSRGLPADAEHMRLCSKVRTEERSLAEIWRLVVKVDFPRKKAVAEALLKTAVQTLASERYQTCLFTLDPDFLAVCERLVDVIVLAPAPKEIDVPYPTVFLRCDVQQLSESKRARSQLTLVPTSADEGGAA